jgi:N-acyl-D-amino-acid deacylase
MPEDHGALRLLVSGGLCFDGTGSPPRRADVGIALDGRIAFVRDASARQAHIHAERVIDATGMAVCPGFIDTHAHSEFTLLADARGEGKVLQGVTTEINGNCGLSAAPLFGPAATQRAPDLAEYAIAARWETFAEYFRHLSEAGPVMNHATLVGHGNLRASVMGYSDRAPTSTEMARMKVLVREAVEAGALGLSTGLIYPPGVYSTPAEIAALVAEGVAARGTGAFVYASHMRSESDGLLASIAETLDVGRATGAAVHVSHIKTGSPEVWHLADAAIALLDAARAEGMSVSVDRYPYTASSTDLDALLPAWAFEGGREAEFERLRDRDALGRMREHLAGRDEAFWASVAVSSVRGEANRWAEGLRMDEIARRMGLAPFDAMVRLLLDENLGVGAIFHFMCEENLRKFLSLPYAMVGSDSAARCLGGPTRTGKPHPRGFGSFPRFLSAVGRAMGGHGLEALIHKLTGLPARTFGLPGRGVLAEGNHADVVVFDPSLIGDRATYEEPYQPPLGVGCVIINGSVVAEHGRLTGERPGRVLGWRE